MWKNKKKDARPTFEVAVNGSGVDAVIVGAADEGGSPSEGLETLCR